MINPGNAIALPFLWVRSIWHGTARRKSCLWLTLCGLISTTTLGAAKLEETCTAPLNAGVAELAAFGKPNSQGIPWLVWYPTDTTEKPFVEGPIPIEAARDAPPLKGKHPVVVLSHGSGGTSLSHWRTARDLARHGYVVLSLVHADDNAAVSSGSSTLEVWNNRPKEWSRALDLLLASRYATVIDARRIAALGFSAGAYTALVMGGARPSSLALDEYCLARGRSDVLCMPYGPVKRAAVRVKRAVGLQHELLDAPADERVSAVVALAPPGAALFTHAGLLGLKVPTLLLQGDQDEVLRYPNDARFLASALLQRAEYQVLPGGHFAFMSVVPTVSDPPRERSAPIAATATLDRANRLTREFLDRILKNSTAAMSKPTCK